MNAHHVNRITFVLNYRKQAVQRRLDQAMKRLATTEQQLQALEVEKEQTTAKLNAAVHAAVDGSRNAQAVTMGHIQIRKATAEHDAKQNRLVRNRIRYNAVRDQAQTDIMENRVSLTRTNGKLDGLERVQKRLSLADGVRAELADEETLSQATIQEK